MNRPEFDPPASPASPDRIKPEERPAVPPAGSTVLRPPPGSADEAGWTAAPTIKAPGKAWLVWGIGAGVYVLAVFHRSSLGVAGPLAAQRLHLSAAQLSSFVMLQLAVYALMQVPTGILVDRFGPRRMLLTATLTMGAGQLMFAFVGGYVPALLARGVLGCGDAMTYISVLRLVAGWFPARRYPVLTSFTGLAGSTGNIMATLPLTGLLHGFGWAPTFAVAGGISVLYGVLLLRPATSAPFLAAQERAADGPVAGRRVWTEVKNAWRLPSGRLGFWVHFTCMAGPTTFATLWGFPYLTQALHYSTGSASSLMLVLVLGGVVANVAIGQIVGRRPEIRTPLAVLVCCSALLGWLVLIAWPNGEPPLPALVAVVIVFSVRTGFVGGIYAGPRLQPAAPDLDGHRNGEHRRLLWRRGVHLPGRTGPRPGGTGPGRPFRRGLPVRLLRGRDRDGNRARPHADLVVAHQGDGAAGRRSW